MLQRVNNSRRGFLRQALGTLTAVGGLPLWYARDILAAALDEPSKAAGATAAESLAMAAIGTGGRGSSIMKTALRAPGVRMLAVCDVDAAHRAKAASDVGNDCRQYADFRELLARDDIDAVTIGTPDHWHAMIALAAIKAGKDVYCEKPLTLCVDEGKVLVSAVRKTGRVFQVGSQQRSDARFRLACELVRNGRLGKISEVEARIGKNPIGGPFAITAPPDSLDWDFWQGPTPDVPYIKERCHNTFRWWYEYSGGKVTDWGAHHNDIAQWALGQDESGPVSVRAESSAIPDDPRSYNVPETFKITYTYDDGVNLVCQSGGENGVKFTGEAGWIFVSRREIQASDPKLLEEPLGPDATRLTVSNNHMGDFLGHVRDRKRPICDVSIGHRSVTVCHIGNIAIRLGGGELRWDPAAETFPDNPKAAAMLSRPMRGAWKLDPA